MSGRAPFRFGRDQRHRLGFARDTGQRESKPASSPRFRLKEVRVGLSFRNLPRERPMSKGGSAKRPTFFVPTLTASPILPVAVAGLAIVIFVIDSMTDQGIAIAVFYVVVVFLAVFFSGARGVLLVSGGCMALTLLSYLLWPRGPVAAGAMDTVISLIAIGATGYFALKIRDAEAAKQEARSQLAHIGRLNTLVLPFANMVTYFRGRPDAGVSLWRFQLEVLYATEEPFRH